MVRQLWTFSNGRTLNHGTVCIDKNGYVNGEFPIEDFGDYLLTSDRLSPANALAKWLTLVEGEQS